MRFLLYCGVILLEGDLLRLFWEGLDDVELYVSLDIDDE